MAKKQTQKLKSTSSSSGGSLRGLRTGFKKMTSSKRMWSKPSKWTFQQVLLAMAGTALVIALVYTMSR